jgi:hypothetical protein
MNQTPQPAQISTTSLEGVARGMSGGLSDIALKGARTLAEKYSEDPDAWAPKSSDVEARANTTEGKVTQGLSMAVGLLTGTGVPGLIAGGTKALLSKTGISALVKAEGAGLFTKLGAAGLTGAIETGLLTGTDSTSKALLGQKGGDPEEAVSNVLSDAGTGFLLGGLMGGAFAAPGATLKSIANSKMYNGAAEQMASFGSRWNALKNFGSDKVAALQDELSNYFSATDKAAHETYGVNGLKDSAIKALVPKEVTPELTGQIQNVTDLVGGHLQNMLSKPDDYPKYLVNDLAQKFGDYQSVIRDPNASPYDIFNAQQTLKQYAQTMSKYDHTVGQFHPGAKFQNDIREMATNLKSSLEDNSVWGGAGDLQKGVNEAWSEFGGGKNSPLANFKKVFWNDKIGDVDPAKVNTYLNQLGKPNAEVKQDVMDSFLEASDNFHKSVRDLHESLGVENSLVPPPTDLARLTTQRDLSQGAKFADYLYGKGIDKLGSNATEIAGGLVGSLAGGVIGGAAGVTPGIVAGAWTAKMAKPFLEASIGPMAKNLGTNGISAAIKVLGSEGAPGLSDAIAYGSKIDKGAAVVKKGVSSLFKTGDSEVSENIPPTDKKKLIDYLKNGGIDQELTPGDSQTSQVDPSSSDTTPKYADGGEVDPTQPPTDDASSPSPIAPSQEEPPQNAIATHFPDQHLMLDMAKGRTMKYLSSLQPTQNISQLTFDTPLPTTNAERHFDNAINIALNPLSVLNRIKDGTLTTEHMKHLTSMYPEVYNQLSKKITAQILQEKQDGNRPPYQVRQALSMFLTAPLDSTMTPQAIQSIQKTFAPSAPPQKPGAPMKGRNGKSAINKLANSYATPNQSSEGRKAHED